MKLKPQRFRGQGLVEYALILVLVAIVVIVILAVLGPEIGNVFSGVVSALEQVSERAAATPEASGPESEPPPECYGTLLLPIMLAATAMVTVLTRFLPAAQVERLFLTPEG